MMRFYLWVSVPGRRICKIVTKLLIFIDLMLFFSVFFLFSMKLFVFRRFALSFFVALCVVAVSWQGRLLCMDFKVQLE